MLSTAELAELDEYEKGTPEQIRGLPPPSNPINWEALEIVCNGIDASPLKRQLLRKKLFKAIKQGGIGVLSPKLRLSYVSARLYLKDFSDYWGWEFRGAYNTDESRTWAADLYWSETWLPKWGGGYVDRLLVLGEQGIGDCVFFASILPECMVRVKEVVYECDERLHTLLERSLPGLRCRSERRFEDRRVDEPPDAYIPAAELMRMFRRSVTDFPARKFLKPDAGRVSQLERFRGRVGVSWAGRQGRIDPYFLDVENPLSLQYNEEHPNIECPGIDLRNDVEGIVALCSVLERVVSVPTSVQHFAGGCGAKVEIVLPPEGSGEAHNQIKWDVPPGKLPWYPDVIVYKDIKVWRAGRRAGMH